MRRDDDDNTDTAQTNLISVIKVTRTAKLSEKTQLTAFLLKWHQPWLDQRYTTKRLNRAAQWCTTIPSSIIKKSWAVQQFSGQSQTEGDTTDRHRDSSIFQLLQLWWGGGGEIKQTYSKVWRDTPSCLKHVRVEQGDPRRQVRRRFGWNRKSVLSLYHNNETSMTLSPHTHTKTEIHKITITLPYLQ